MPTDLLTLLAIVAAIAVVAGIICLLPGEPGTCHRAPAEPYDEGDAHEVLQARLDCTMSRCDAKRAAYWALVDLGVIRQDPRAVR